ncbi:acyloxyacyl hydrolase [Flavobacterium kingsejongi]|uniref:Deacylase n=1 Tax=Flavobacterium kingsejongi TaxID=1678728 RepID=A0A2S1LN57_9FLAO|nr:acyloxyacyl hydrolase [Flavobacterium kingsejongi]AWG25164.1 deacylase [Flavobacterium kingsejongi]
MHRIVYLFFIFTLTTFAQESPRYQYSVDANYYYGNILKHSDAIAPLIKGHPDGFLLSVNRKTFGHKAWESRYNYPDYGISLHYEDMKNEVLGKNYGAYLHYNFYFFQRNLMLRVGQGVAYTTNPYDAVSNPENVAYGTHWMPTTYFLLNFKKENLWKGFGVQAGVSFFHHSNANLRSPNTSTNTIAFNVGATYTINTDETPEYIKNTDTVRFTQPLKYNLVFRSGVNESDLIGAGQLPFYVYSGFVDKRINRKSALQIGADYFVMKYLQDTVNRIVADNPNGKVKSDTDYKKIGVFIGHELFINHLSVETQIGCYAYRPLDYLDPIYQRIGAKYYFGETIFAEVSLKTHAAKAEAIEFSLGIRL